MLITSQLAIASQFKKKVHLWRIRLFLGSGNKNGLEKDDLVDKTTEGVFALF